LGKRVKSLNVSCRRHNDDLDLGVLELLLKETKDSSHEICELKAIKLTIRVPFKQKLSFFNVFMLSVDERTIKDEHVRSLIEYSLDKGFQGVVGESSVEGVRSISIHKSQVTSA
jgi:hypothetical protein